MLKNKFFTILLMLILVSPAFGEPILLEEPEQLTPISSQETAGNTVQEKLPELDTIEYKQPVSKRKVAKKFLAAMAGVGKHYPGSKRNST